ncbi:hypothetical protein C8250_015775 [Streptomyces sp. So13.3]|uniref:polymorphic toxin-type HINT domain-containing protein n=1 Tax=unclassified Streptomyces TaxID=2593676 RepID=UPI0011059988|nr:MULTISPECIES: polymorphic toxin-type HINT domain-containing protein [unclassified Streptomyces]NEA75039.1 hypothetical protein [Streptomyces sp. SID13588]QNA73182.1 hypothetical protein C8250_015775 [Streptomyces sp. So13.3]
MGRFGVRGLAVSLAVSALVGALPAASIAAPGIAPAGGFPVPKKPVAVPVTSVATGGNKPRKDAAAARSDQATSKVVWPAAGSAEVDLTAIPSPARTKSAAPSLVARSPQRAGALPVTIAPVATGTRAGSAEPTKVKVTVADRAVARTVGVDGVLLSVVRADNATTPVPVQVQVDYTAFRGAYGGDWAARLHLVQMPACALTTPDKPTCRLTRPVDSHNNTKSDTLTAQVDAAPQTTAAAARAVAPTSATVLALTAGASGSSGDYKATSLQPSGSWSQGGSSGAFTWSYPIGVPSVPGSLQPSVSLGYSSQAVDGKTAASNSQAGWLGDGWAYEPGFIERRYKSCNDDQTGGTNTTKVGDLCYSTSNATLSLGGKNTELVYQSGKGWHAAEDSGEKIEKLTNATTVTGNGDNDGEHWKVTTTDGTQYFFGLNRLPGWKDGSTPETNSTLTVPVFGNQPGEPCYNASFAAAHCDQAWRWQLDYVVDTHNNAMAYYWKQETNNYGLNVSESTGKATATGYDRAGYLDHIDYGLRSDAVYSGKAMGKVTFAVDERCESGCDTFDETNAKNWKDVPFDQYCKDGAECKDQYSPTFWSRKRLKTITTQVLTGGAYKDVDSWALAQTFPPAGDGISTPMWLNSILRTGLAGGNIPLPLVTFSGEQHDNRVDKLGDGLAPFVRLRMSQVTTETGGTIGVYYSDPGCTVSSLPPADATNTTRCYPVKWAYEGETAKQDWFNSYVVTKVLEGDNLATTPDKETTYAYPDGAAWAKSTDEFTKADDRTYSIARGYGRVQTRTGTDQDPKTLTEARYFRGIDGAAVADSSGATVTDREQFAGMVRETATYNGDDTTKLIAATSNTPWRSVKTATRLRPGLPDLDAYHTGIADEQTRTIIATGTRATSSHREFDAYGMVTTLSLTGDTAVTGDESCTTTTYARNTSTWLLNKVSRTQTVAKTCGTPVTLPQDLLHDARTYYDSATTWGDAPSKGDVVKSEQINGKGDNYETSSGVPSACGTKQDELCYDIYGRALVATDAYGKKTTSSYSPATGEVATQIVVTNPLGFKTVTVVDPLRNQATSMTDANSRVTSTTYDPLGRTTQIWAPGRSASDYPTAPSYKFDYLVRNNGPIVVTTSSLTHNADIYQTSYAISDGLLRPVQTQAPAADDSGRTVTETFYDTRGLAWRSSGTYFAAGSPEAALVTGEELKYPSSADTVYDGAGRVTAAIARRFGVETKRTTTSYTGDTTTVVPPKGLTATTTVVDALGRARTVKQYTDAARTTWQTTTYTYNDHGQLAQVKDASNATWTYTYDVRGRQTQTSDPDKGTSLTTYDQGDRVTDVTDARGITLHTDYDALGRRTAFKQGTNTLSAWTYDTATGGIGQPATSTRYVGTAAYTSAITAYNERYEPTESTVTVPSVPGAEGLAATYAWSTEYYPTGQLKTTSQPALGGLPEEDVLTAYSYHASLPVTLRAGDGDDSLVSNTVYDAYGRPSIKDFGGFGKKIHTTSTYDDHTGALTDQTTDRDLAPARIDATHYTYDPAGNITSTATTSGQGTTASTDTQCFTMDALRRITQAWTGTDKCAATPSGTSSATVGGPDTYWTSYAYDALGNRTTETQHKTPAGPANDATRTYKTPPTGKHNLPGVSIGSTDVETYTYDLAGNTKTRKAGTTAQQDLTWDSEGHLEKVVQGTISTSYTYDTAGQRLLRKDSTGTTLYLPGGNELLLKPNGTKVGTRYYDLAGQTVAMRTAGKITFLLADPNGTATTQIDATTQAITRRKTTIFGAPRGAAPTGWTGDKSFVGGTKDADTGLTHLGAREYDPNIGRFISVDPLMDLADPQQINGYTYANNNPVSNSDPSGMICMRGDCNAPGAGQNGGNGPAPGDPQYDDNVNYCSKNDCDRTGDPGAQGGSGSGSAGGSGSGDSAGQGRWTVTHCSKAGCKKKWTTQPRGNDKDFVAGLGQGVISTVEAGCQLFKLFGEVECGADAYRKEMADRGIGVNSQNYETGSDVGAAGVSAIPAFGPYVRVAEEAQPFFRVLGECFLAGTGVLMADGTRKNIEDIKIGETVLATDPETGKTSQRAVTATITTEGDKKFADLTIATTGGPKSLVATDGHRFWVASAATWIEAGDLQPGMTLRTDEGRTVSVLAVRHFAKHARTYNLTIADLHTYYVFAGNTPVLVHNDCTTAPRFAVNSNGVATDLSADMSRAYKPFTPKGKREVIAKNRADNGGRLLCDDCRAGLVPAAQSRTGGGVNRLEVRVDHIWPQSLGGPGSPWNGRAVCYTCNETWSNTPKGPLY